LLDLSGILDQQGGSVIEAAQGHSLGLIEQRQIGDWVALAFERQ
jgi:ribosomal protein L11 methylase PrmA